jgi:hypothetical protein
MIIEVHGHQIEVDDSFASMSPDQQQSTLQDIDNQVGLHQQAQQEQQQANQPQPGQPTPAEQQLMNAQQGAAAVPIGAYHMANQFVQSPLGHAATYGAGGAYALKEIKNMVKPSTPPADTAIAQSQVQAQTAQNTGTYGRTLSNGTKTINVPGSQTSSLVDEGMRVAQAVQKTAASKIAGIGNFLGKAGLAAQIGTGLMYTSPQEKAVLQEEENKKRAMGWQPADPLHGRFFSGYPNGQTQPAGPVNPNQQY